jgi:hypothetical protein
MTERRYGDGLGYARSNYRYGPVPSGRGNDPMVDVVQEKPRRLGKDERHPVSQGYQIITFYAREDRPFVLALHHTTDNEVTSECVWPPLFIPSGTGRRPLPLAILNVVEEARKRGDLFTLSQQAQKELETLHCFECGQQVTTTANNVFASVIDVHYGKGPRSTGSRIVVCHECLIAGARDGEA